jgi:hypothetical protein
LDQLKKALRNLSRFASKAGVREGKKEIMQISVEDVRDLRKDLLADLFGMYIALKNWISSIVSSQEQILKATDSITRKTEGINGRTGKEIEDKVAKVNDTTDQIASTTKAYRDTLLSPNQASLSEPCSTSNSWTTPRDFEVSDANRDVSCSGVHPPLNRPPRPTPSR